MKKKRTKHFVPKKNFGNGYAACSSSFYAVTFLDGGTEVAKTRRGVTCGNCKRTRVFRKLK